MTGICSYKDLADYYYWDNKFGYRDCGWYILILGHLNPYQESPALKLILDQYTYLNRLTKDVRYFMPGFMIGEKGIIASRQYRHLDKFFFDEVGFLDTVEWLETSSNYEYSEDTALDLENALPNPNISMTFAGWFNALEQEVFSIPAQSSGTVDLYAHFDTDVDPVWANALHEYAIQKDGITNENPFTMTITRAEYNSLLNFCLLNDLTNYK